MPILKIADLIMMPQGEYDIGVMHPKNISIG